MANQGADDGWIFIQNQQAYLQTEKSKLKPI
jgi:hypothetical protein